jgi:hypothetical protein
MREVFVRKPKRRFEAIPIAEVLKSAVEVNGKSRLEKKVTKITVKPSPFVQASARTQGTAKNDKL